MLCSAVLSLSAIVVSPAAHAIANGGGAFNGKGFDTCAAPSSYTMQKWWTSTPWSFIGVYIGGNSRACSQPNLTASWMNTTNSQGWRYELIWVGPQAPCTTFANRISYDTATAYNQGKAESTKSYNALINLGFTNGAAGTPTVYDMEGYPNNSSCRAAVKAFMQGWVDQHAVAPAQVAGTYGSTCGSFLDDLAYMTRPVNFIVGAAWDGNVSTSVMSCIGGTHWTNHHRIKQYRGDHNETWGGVTLNIDSQCANGPLAPTGSLAWTVCN
jgi:hypothetical protein